MITYIKNFLSSLFKRRLFKGSPGRNDEAWAKLIVSHVNMAVEEEQARTSIEALAEKCLDVHSRFQSKQRDLEKTVTALERSIARDLDVIRDNIDTLAERVMPKPKRKLRKVSKKR